LREGVQVAQEMVGRRSDQSDQSGITFGKASAVCNHKLEMSIDPYDAVIEAPGPILALLGVAVLFVSFIRERVWDVRELQVMKGKQVSLPGKWLGSKGFCMSQAAEWFGVDNGQLFQLGGYLAINLLLFFVPVLPDYQLQTVANRAAWLGLGNAFFLLMLATRNSVMPWLVGMTFERSIIYHKWCGTMVGFLFVLHGILQLIHMNGYTSQLSIPRNIFGLIAWICLIFILITSSPIVRRRWFRVFYWTHFAFLIVVIAGSVHDINVLWYTLGGLLLWLIDRGIRMYKSRRVYSVVSRTVYNQHVKVEVAGTFNNTPGQYMFVQQGKGLDMLDWHPYSTLSAPGSETLTFVAKASGDWSEKFVAASAGDEAGGDDAIRLDGFYGTPKLRFALYDSIVLFSGGVGFTAMHSIARDVANRMSIPHGEGTKAYATQKLFVVHYCRTMADLMVFSKELSELAVLGRQVEQYGASIYLLLFLTDSTETESLPPVLAKHVKPKMTVDTMLGGILQRTTGSIAVGVCGPAGLIQDVRNSVGWRTSDSKRVVDVHVEVFEL